jgi:phosphoglycerate kinase
MAIFLVIKAFNIMGICSILRSGGDSVAAINKYNLANQVSYVSTGGGALLEYIENGTLPGVSAIN